MRFVLYSPKSVNQCMTAIHERMHTRPTNSRPSIDGWVEKSGSFSISLDKKVAWRFNRRTHLRGKAEREGSTTVISGYVPSGVSREGQAVIFAALVLVAGAILTSGNAILGLVVIGASAALFIPLTGDYQNSAILMSELQKTLQAKETPPDAAKPSTRTSRARR